MTEYWEGYSVDLRSHSAIHRDELLITIHYSHSN